MRKIALAAALTAYLAAPHARGADDPAAAAQRWKDLSKTLFDGRDAVDQAGWVTIDAPVGRW